MENTIFRLPYAAHTLQLSVGKGLNLVKNLVFRTKRLIDFFNISLKQREWLQTTQEFLGYASIKHIIDDVSTCWNSTYYAWERLIELKRAIKFLPRQLKSDLNKDTQKDGEKLEKIMLSDDEWLLIENLLDLLFEFEEVTRLLSGAKYCIISSMYPAISALIVSIKAIQVDQIVTPVISLSPLSNTLNFELNPEDNNITTDNEEEITILDNIKVIIDDNKNKVEIKVIDLTSNTDHNKKKINISEPIKTTNMISKIQKILYNSIFNYWKDINKVEILACLLDSCFKKLQFVK